VRSTWQAAPSLSTPAHVSLHTGACSGPLGGYRHLVAVRRPPSHCHTGILQPPRARPAGQQDTCNGRDALRHIFWKCGAQETLRSSLAPKKKSKKCTHSEARPGVLTGTAHDFANLVDRA